MTTAANVREAQAPSRAEAIRWDDLVATVHRQMRSIAGPARDLEDLTQTALEQVLRSIERFEGRGDLTTFTYRICVHVAMNQWRWWRRWMRRFDLGSAATEPADTRAGPHELCAERLRALHLHAALGRLTPVHRIVLTLSDLEDLPAARIADILDCPEPTVRSRLRQARARLTEILARDPIFVVEKP